MLMEGNIVVDSGRFVGKGRGDAMKILATGNTSRTFVPASTSRKLILTACYKDTPTGDLKPSEVMTHEVNLRAYLDERPDGLPSLQVTKHGQHIFMVSNQNTIPIMVFSKIHCQLFTEDGGKGAKHIDFNDAMLTVRQYKATVPLLQSTPYPHALGV